MKPKVRIIIEILLVITAIVMFAYNLSMQRTTLYISSAIAVCGTIALLVQDLIKLKR